MPMAYLKIVMEKRVTLKSLLILQYRVIFKYGGLVSIIVYCVCTHYVSNLRVKQSNFDLLLFTVA